MKIIENPNFIWENDIVIYWKKASSWDNSPYYPQKIPGLARWGRDQIYDKGWRFTGF